MRASLHHSEFFLYGTECKLRRPSPVVYLASSRVDPEPVQYVALPCAIFLVEKWRKPRLPRDSDGAPACLHAQIETERRIVACAKGMVKEEARQSAVV